MKTIRVLFIDDDQSSRLLAEAVFKHAKFDVALAADAQEAEKILLERSFDVIVCDVMMPGENGIDFCRRIKQSGNKTPFLFLSALDGAKLVSQGLMIGAMAYLYKPFDPMELPRKILALVEQNSSARQEPSI